MERDPIPTRRIAAVVAYEGTDFSGFQAQAEGRTVAGVLADAARTLGAGDPCIKCAGRTDAGVHADGQVVALSLPLRLDERRILPALNANLPEDVRILATWPCAAEFDPRRDAIMRTYVYRLCAGAILPPVHRRRVAALPRPLDPLLCSEAARAYLGQWEFREWRSSQCQGRRTLLTISAADFSPAQASRPWMEITFSARSFLHHMVRFLVGGIIAVGSRRLTPGELAGALAAGKRPAVVVPAPACGLTLARVDYPGARGGAGPAPGPLTPPA